MRRKEQLEFCKVCTNQKFDSHKGIICGLTNDRATFEVSCDDFNEDMELATVHAQRKEDEAWYNQNATAQTRFVNYLLDFIFIMICNVLVGVILGIALALLAPDALTIFDDDDNLIFNFISFGVFFSYYAVLEGLAGRTIGKVITKTIVVTEDGKKPEFSTILLRSLCRFIPFEAFSFLGDGKGWHDKLSKTRVVYMPKN